MAKTLWIEGEKKVSTINHGKRRKVSFNLFNKRDLNKQQQPSSSFQEYGKLLENWEKLRTDPFVDLGVRIHFERLESLQ